MEEEIQRKGKLKEAAMHARAKRSDDDAVRVNVIRNSFLLCMFLVLVVVDKTAKEIKVKKNNL